MCDKKRTHADVLLSQMGINCSDGNWRQNDFFVTCIVFYPLPSKKWSFLLPFWRKSNIKQSIGKLQGISGQNYTFLQLGNFFVVMEGQTLLQTSINQHVDGNSFLFFGDVVISNVLLETVVSSFIIAAKALS